MLTEFKSSEEKQMLGPQSGEISWPRMQKTSKLKDSYFQLKKDEEEGEEAEAKRFAATHQIRIDPPAANKLLLLFFAQTLQSETLLLLLLLIVYSWCRRNNNSLELHLESATVKKEPWKKTTFFCFEIFQQCQSILSMQQQYKPYIPNISIYEFHSSQPFTQNTRTPNNCGINNGLPKTKKKAKKRRKQQVEANRRERHGAGKNVYGNMVTNNPKGSPNVPWFWEFCGFP
jgi:hypothetical protein